MSDHVRITKASADSYWYVKWVGKIFDVVAEEGDDYRVKGKRIADALIAKSDCEPVTLHNGEYFREVSRKAREGELVKITDNKSGGRPEGYVDTVKHRDDIPADDTGVCLTQGYSHGDDEYVVLEPVASDEAAPRTTDDLIANLALRVSTLEQQTATRLTKLEKRATQTETNLAFLDDGNEIASLQKQVDEIRDNLRTFAEQTESNSGKLGHIEKDVEEALAGVDVTDRSIKWAHHRISNAEKAAKDTDWKAEMALDDIVTLDERTHAEPTGSIDVEALITELKSEAKRTATRENNHARAGGLLYAKGVVEEYAKKAADGKVSEYTIPVRNWRAPNDYETYESGADE
jgi:uncharacterized coiled-coil protein SlyX